MSKMSQLHLTLDEQAVDLGFEGLGEALMKGYDVDYEKGKLVRRGLGYSETVEYLAKEQQKAHEAWLKEKQQVLDELTDVINDGELDWGEIVRKVEHALEFIRGIKSE